MLENYEKRVYAGYYKRFDGVLIYVITVTRDIDTGEDSDGSGGYLVPDTFNDTLLEGLTEKNVLRQLAHVIPTTHRMHIPVSNGMGDATWVIEGEPWSFNEASFKISANEIKLHKITGFQNK